MFHHHILQQKPVRETTFCGSVTAEVCNLYDQSTLHENSPLLFSVNVLKCFSLHFTDIYGP